MNEHVSQTHHQKKEKRVTQSRWGFDMNKTFPLKRLGGKTRPGQTNGCIHLLVVAIGRRSKLLCPGQCGRQGPRSSLRSSYLCLPFPYLTPPHLPSSPVLCVSIGRCLSFSDDTSSLWLKRSEGFFRSGHRFLAQRAGTGTTTGTVNLHTELIQVQVNLHRAASTTRIAQNSLHRPACAEQLRETCEDNPSRATCPEALGERSLHEALAQSNLRAANCEE